MNQVAIGADDKRFDNIVVKVGLSFHAIWGSASMTLTLFAEDCIQEREDDAYHEAKAELGDE
jgi:hypothetical protein